MDATPAVSYVSVIDAIRAGLSRVRGTGLLDEDLTEHTRLWPAVDRDHPTLALDSLDLLELVVFLEDQFGWAIPDDMIDVPDCQTVGDLAGLVMRTVNGAP
jgi:acyl carrier protein